MKLFEVRLELTVNPGHPIGNRLCGYTWLLPLDGNYQIDVEAWEKNPELFTVTRFWDSESDREGQLARTLNGSWCITYQDGDQEPVFQLEQEKLLPGEFVDIRDHGDQMHIFQIVSTSFVSMEASQQSHGDGIVKNTGGDAVYYEIKLSIKQSDNESFLGSEYLLTLALDENGKVDLAEWERNGSKWRATYTDSSGNKSEGNLVASNHVWYIHLSTPVETYELIKRMESQDFLATHSDLNPLLIRDRLGHWHEYSVLSHMLG